MTSEQPSDCIILSELLKREVQASAAELYVTVRGSSLFTGQAALKKAKEIAVLVEALTGSGLEQDQILVHNISMNVESGVLSKSSSAQYTLKIRASLEQLPDLLTVIANAKNANLQSIAWRYEEDDERDLQWIEEGLAQAKIKAHRIAKGLGVTIVGLRECRVNKSQLPQPGHDQMAPMLAAMRRRSETVDLGMPIAQSTEKYLQLDIQFRIETVR
jgi:uncharacterized protein YggE